LLVEVLPSLSVLEEVKPPVVALPVFRAPTNLGQCKWTSPTGLLYDVLRVQPDQQQLDLEVRGSSIRSEYCKQRRILQR
jgi:hypothetical protein